MIIVERDPLLARDEREALAELEEELGQLADNGGELREIVSARRVTPDEVRRLYKDWQSSLDEEPGADEAFAPISFQAFGNAVKDGMPMRNMPRIAAEPFMRVVGEMLDLEEAASQEVVDAKTVDEAPARLKLPDEATSDAPPAQEPVGAPEDKTRADRGRKRKGD